jgi:probable FeS assembly SUF system protein SufT
MNEPVEFAYESSVVQIPDGTPLVVPVGTRGAIIQVLGGNFTVRLDTGHLVRVSGQDAGAIGREVPEEARGPSAGGDVEDQVWAQLRTCFDPEIPVNIVDLGLIYGLAVQDAATEPGAKVVKITMTLTAPGCGMGQVLKDDVESKVRAIPGVIDAQVELTFEPPWGPDRMTEEAQLELGFY